MAIINGIDYGDLIFSERYKLDQEAYSKYYDDYFEKGAKTYNEWYGTKTHKKYLSALLPYKKWVRKLKLEKLEKLNEIDD